MVKWQCFPQVWAGVTKEEEKALFTYLLYGAAVGALLLSFFKDRGKTVQALQKAWRSVENILPQLLALLLLVGMVLSVLNAGTISKLLGSQSGVLGMAIAAVLGSVTLIPGFVAFPLAAALLHAGAGWGQITMFVTTLMMVGIVTLPMEIQYFGKPTAIKRNLLALLYAVGISFLIGGLLR